MSAKDFVEKHYGIDPNSDDGFYAVSDAGMSYSHSCPHEPQSRRKGFWDTVNVEISMKIKPDRSGRKIPL